MNEFWQHCSALLERELTPQQYVTWIKPLAPVAFDAAANTLSIAAPNRFKLDWVKSQFSGRIADLARDFWQRARSTCNSYSTRKPACAPCGSRAGCGASGFGAEFHGGSAGNAAAADAAVGAVQAAQAARGPNSANSAMANLNANARAAAERNANARACSRRSRRPRSAEPRRERSRRGAPHMASGPSASSNGNGENDSMYERSEARTPVLTFDNFVTGKANQLARAAAIQVADNPGISYNPLFLYGGVGLGMTHLIHAIGNQLLMDKAGARIRYIHAEQYVSDVVKAYQRKAFDDFKRYYHSLDLLLIDDIQFFSGKSRTQEEFFYAFEALRRATRRR